MTADFHYASPSARIGPMRNLSSCRCQNPSAGQAAFAEIRVDALARAWQSRGDLKDMFVFCLLLLGAELGVVEVLAAPRRVCSHRLQMAVGTRADPHVPPGGGMTSALMRLSCAGSFIARPEASK